jgi:hypothetical protein
MQKPTPAQMVAMAKLYVRRAAGAVTDATVAAKLEAISSLLGPLIVEVDAHGR